MVLCFALDHSQVTETLCNVPNAVVLLAALLTGEVGTERVVLNGVETKYT